MLNNCRNDFPTLQGDNPPAYLDNACVTLKPQSVIDSIHRYYTETPGCGGRSVHRYGTAVSKAVVDARTKLGSFQRSHTQRNCLHSKCHAFHQSSRPWHDVEQR